MEIMGLLPNSTMRSIVTSSAFSSGDAGRIEIDTQRVVVRDGGGISSSSVAYGSAGNITINAAESVEISGAPTPEVTSNIRASTVVLDEFVRKIFGLPDVPTGDAGKVVVRTENLSVSDGGRLAAFGAGGGNAGTLQIDARNLFVADGGQVATGSVSGEGGKITIEVSDILSLQRRSQISATAGGSGNGGAIAIGATFTSLQEESRIAADAFEGIGGNVQISTERVLVSCDSDITANSAFGLEGDVEILGTAIDAAAAFLPFPNEAKNEELAGANPVLEGDFCHPFGTSESGSRDRAAWIFLRETSDVPGDRFSLNGARP